MSGAVNNASQLKILLNQDVIIWALGNMPKKERHKATTPEIQPTASGWALPLAFDEVMTVDEIPAEASAPEPPTSPQKEKDNKMNMDTPGVPENEDSLSNWDADTDNTHTQLLSIWTSTAERQWMSAEPSQPAKAGEWHIVRTDLA